MKWLKKEEWSPYVGGIVIGLVSWFAFLTVKPLGASSTFVRIAGMTEKLFAPEHVKSLPYFIEKAPKIDWQFSQGHREEGIVGSSKTYKKRR